MSLPDQDPQGSGFARTSECWLPSSEPADADNALCGTEKGIDKINTLLINSCESQTILAVKDIE